MTSRIPDGRHRPAGSGQHRGGQVRRAATEPDADLGNRHATGAADVRAAVHAGFHRDVHEHHGVACGRREAQHLRARQAVDLSRHGHHRQVADVRDSVATGASVSATFQVTSGPAPFNGDLIGNVSWTNPANGGRRSATTARRCGTSSPIEINEFRAGTSQQPDQWVHRALQLRRCRRRPVELDPDRAPGPAAHLLDGDRPSRNEARGSPVLPARPVRLGAGGPGQRGRAPPSTSATPTGLAPGQQVQIGSRLRRPRPARSPTSPTPARPGPAYRARSATPSAVRKRRVREPAERHRQRAARLHDLRVGQPVRQHGVVAVVRLRHRHQRLHVPHAQRRRRPAPLRHAPPAGTAPSSSSTPPATSR